MNILQKHQANLQRLRSKIKSVCAGAMFMGTLLLAQDAQAQNFVFDTAQINPFGLAPIYARPTATSLGDLDNDGDLDLLAGESAKAGSFFYYENIGSSTNPIFATGQLNPYRLSNHPYSNLPRLVDLDGDNDLDVLSGGNDNFYFYENTGTANNPYFSSPTVNSFGLASIPNNINGIDLADLDNDGDLDLLAANTQWYYYQNIGTSTAPTFAVPQINPFNLITNAIDQRPTFFDADGDGDFDILRGGYSNDFYYYENVGTNTNPYYDTEIMNPFGLSSSPSQLNTFCIADLDGDGKKDLLSGLSNGNFRYFQNKACIVFDISSSNITNSLTVNVSAPATYQWLDCATNSPIIGQTTANFTPNMSGNFAVIATNGNCVDTSACFSFVYSAIDKAAENQTLIFPNPAQELVNIQTSKAWQNATIRLVNLNGQVIQQQQSINGNQISLNLANLPNWIYIVEIETAAGINRHKISKQ